MQDSNSFLKKVSGKCYWSHFNWWRNDTEKYCPKSNNDFSIRKRVNLTLKAPYIFIIFSCYFNAAKDKSQQNTLWTCSLYFTILSISKRVMIYSLGWVHKKCWFGSLFSDHVKGSSRQKTYQYRLLMWWQHLQLMYMKTGSCTAKYVWIQLTKTGHEHKTGHNSGSWHYQCWTFGFLPDREWAHTVSRLHSCYKHIAAYKALYRKHILHKPWFRYDDH